MKTSNTRPLIAERRRIAERQRMAGVMLADWIQFNAHGNHSPETSAKIEHYIAQEVRRIERLTQQLLEIDNQIEEKTKGMSSHLKRLLVSEGIIF